jgi:hypothetical protein
MQTHDQFEQICALAACGDIGIEESERLKAHLDGCVTCSGVFADLRQIHAEFLPAHKAFKVVGGAEADLKLRRAILERASRAGAQFSEAAQLCSQIKSVPLHAWSSRLWLSTAAAVLLVCIAIGPPMFERARRRFTWRNNVPAESEIALHASAVSKPQTVAPAELAQAKERISTLEKWLRESRATQAVLRADLQEAEGRENALQKGKSDSTQLIAGLNTQLETNRADRARIEAELKGVQASEATHAAITTVQQQEIRELNARLEQRDNSLDRERDLLSAGREIRDLIAARNLHIIDVYDTDGNGKTSRAFGRVFYTEGRSLVFYAYDLNSQQRDAAKYAFYVWGKRDGSPHDIKSLGKLSKDDQTQKRWVLTITNPKILAEIDSVFVTLEPADRLGTKPSGKPLLSAFLNSPPNHP